MEESLKFSVLMPVYFKENPEYFDTALESIVNQTLMPNEIIIVKDAIKSHYNEDGVLILNLFDFLLEESSLEN